MRCTEACGSDYQAYSWQKACNLPQPYLYKEGQEGAAGCGAVPAWEDEQAAADSEQQEASEVPRHEWHFLQGCQLTLLLGLRWQPEC